MNIVKMLNAVFAPVLAIVCTLGLSSAQGQQAGSSGGSSATAGRATSTSSWGAGRAAMSGGGSSWTAGRGSFGSGGQRAGVGRAGSGVGMTPGAMTSGADRNPTTIKPSAFNAPPRSGATPHPPLAALSSPKPITGRRSLSPSAAQHARLSSRQGGRTLSGRGGAAKPRTQMAAIGASRMAGHAPTHTSAFSRENSSELKKKVRPQL